MAVRSTLAAEGRALFSLAWPIVATFVAGFSVPLVTVIFVGRSGSTVELAGLALGTLSVNVSGISIVVGLLSAYDTMGSQSYGAGRHRDLGVVLIAAVGVSLCVCLPIAALWLAKTPIEALLVFVGQDRETAHLAAAYAQWQATSLPFITLSEAVKRFLQVQHVVRPMLWIGILTLALHCVFCYLLVDVFGLGITGASLSTSVSYATSLCILLAYIARCSPQHPDSWPGFSRALLQDAVRCSRAYLRLGVPGMMNLAMEWWSFEVLAVGAGILGVKELAAHTVTAQIVPLAFMVPLGLGIATSVRVGNLLGEGRPDAARLVAKCALGVGEILAILIASAILLARNVIGYIFSDDAEVDFLVAKVLPFVCLFILFDYWQGVAQGVVRGCGRQVVGLAIVLIGNYCIALPMAFMLAMPASRWSLGFGLAGLWAGMDLGYGVVALLFVLFFFCYFDWSRASVIAVARCNDGRVSTTPSAERRNGNGFVRVADDDGDDDVEMVSI